MHKLRYFQITDPGRVRPNNEDNMAIADPHGDALRAKKGVLFAVADGLGGLENGEIASQTAVEALSEWHGRLKKFAGPEDLREAVRRVNQKVYGLNEPREKSAWMATTLTASVFHDEFCFTAHVGDSRLYQIRQGRLKRITTDHSIDRYTLTRCIGTDPDVEVDLYPISLEAGDIYLQCSDGLHGAVPDAEILETVCSRSPEEACRRLVRAANQYGGPDNITLQVIAVGNDV